MEISANIFRHAAVRNQTDVLKSLLTTDPIIEPARYVTVTSPLFTNRDAWFLDEIIQLIAKARGHEANPPPPPRQDGSPQQVAANGSNGASADLQGPVVIAGETVGLRQASAPTMTATLMSAAPGQNPPNAVTDPNTPPARVALEGGRDAPVALDHTAWICA